MCAKALWQGPVIRRPWAGTEPRSQCGRNCDGAPGVLQGLARRSSLLGWGAPPKVPPAGLPFPRRRPRPPAGPQSKGKGVLGKAARTLPASQEGNPGATVWGRPFLPSAPKGEVLRSFLVCSGTLLKPLVDPGPRSDPSEGPHSCGSHLREAGCRPLPLIIKGRGGDRAREGECSRLGDWRDLKVSSWAGAAFACQGIRVPAPPLCKVPIIPTGPPMPRPDPELCLQAPGSL